MTHSEICEYAKGDLCRCECEGEFHGIKDREEEEHTEESSFDEEMTISFESPQKTILQYTKGNKEPMEELFNPK